MLREVDGRFGPLSPTDTLKMPGYDLRSTLDSMPFLAAMVGHLRELEWGVYSFDHEGGRGQFEFDFGYADALTARGDLPFQSSSHRGGMIPNRRVSKKPRAIHRVCNGSISNSKLAPDQGFEP